MTTDPLRVPDPAQLSSVRNLLSPSATSTTLSSSAQTAATDAAATTAAAASEPTAEASSGGASEGASSAGDTAATASDPLATASAATAFTSPSATAESSNSNDNEQGDGQGLTAAQSQNGGSGMSSGTKIGVGVGVGVGIAVIIALIAIFFIMRRRRRKNHYTSTDTYNAEQMRGQPGMTSTEPALGGAAALGRSLSYRSNNRSSYHSLSPTDPPPLPHTAAMAEAEPATPEIETAKGTIPAQPTIIPPSQTSLTLEPPENQTPRSRRSMEAEIVPSPGGAASLASPAPPAYEDTPSPLEEHPERSVSPVSPVSSMGSRPGSLRRSFSGRG